MDEIDMRIIGELKENGRATASEISRRISLSVPAVAERIRKLEQSGVIEGYTIRVNRNMTGFSLLAFILVTVAGSENIENFRVKLVRERCVLECHHIAGPNDYLLKVLVRDTAELESFLSQTLKKINGVAASNTIISLSALKERINV